MATKETYEAGAKVLASRAHYAQDSLTKMQIMGYLTNLRYNQYEATREPRAKRLAENCLNAATKLFHRAITEIR